MHYGGEAILWEDRIFNDAVLEILREKWVEKLEGVCM